MPLYEFQCLECGRIVEALQKIDDPAPECHGPMKRLISRSSFHLKGKGWYKTDYQDKPKEKSKKRLENKGCSKEG